MKSRIEAAAFSGSGALVVDFDGTDITSGAGVDGVVGAVISSATRESTSDVSGGGETGDEDDDETVPGDVGFNCTADVGEGRRLGFFLGGLESFFLRDKVDMNPPLLFVVGGEDADAILRIGSVSLALSL